MKTGWETKSIGELCDIIGGGTPSKSNAAFFNGDIPWATVRDMKADWIERTEHSITPEAVKNSATHILPSGTVVIASRVGLGKICRVGYNTAINQDLRGFIPKVPAQLDTQYLFWWFKSVADHIIEAGNGATVQGVTLPFLRSMVIPLPPLDEQRRIVEVLDKAFAGIATATTNAQKNLTNARALFDAYLETIFSKRGAGWRDITLGNACKVERGSSPRPIKSFVTTNDDGLNWVKIGDTKNDSKYVTQTAQRITPAGALKSRKVDPGDFILTNSMSFGKPYIMKISGYIHDGWFALRLGEQTDTEYFYYLLSSPVVQKQFQNLAAGAIVLNISGDLVKKAILPLPPVEQQRELVKLIQIQDNKTKQLKAIYEKKIGALSELKQSLFQKAFAGELT